MPLRRKTRSKGRSSSDANSEDLSPTSNGGRTHPKEMYAPDRATRSRTSSEDLVILELPKNTRAKPNNQAKPVKQSREDAKSKKAVDGLNKKTSNNSKQVNNVNNSGPSPHLNDSTPGASRRTRRRSGRLSGDSGEKEPKNISPHAAEQSVARSERRRKRSGNEAELDVSPVGTDNKTVKSDGSRRRRRLSSTDDKSPVGKTDNIKGTKKNVSNSKKLEPDGDDGHFKVPSISNKLKSSSDSSDVTLHDSPRANRRHAPGKSASIDTVLNVDVDVTSQDSLLTRTSPRRPKVSPRNADKNSVKEGDKISPVSNNAASKETPPVSPRTRSTASALPKHEQEEEPTSSSTSDSSRKRQPSGSSEADAAATHSSKKRKRTGSVCRDLTTEFEERGKSGNSESIPNCDADDKVTDDDSVSDKPDSELKDNSNNILDVQSLHEDDGISPSVKSHKKGTLTPTNSPRRGKSPGRTPSRRGLRSSGQVPHVTGDVPSELTEEPKEVNDLDECKESVTEESSASVEENASVQRTEETTENRTEDRTEDNQGDLDHDGKPVVEELEDFTGDYWYEDVEDTELFFFESDHVALKGNRDYRMMLRTLTTLEAQRKQAVQDLDLLVDKKKESLQDPLTFAQKLQQREDVGLPNSQRVVVIPDIDWTKYLGAAEAVELAGFKHQTRGAKSSSSKHSTTAGKHSNTSNINVLTAVSQLSQKSTGGSQSSSQSQQQQQQQQQQLQQTYQVSSQQLSTSSTPDLFLSTIDRKESFVVRGRSVDPNKPASFNQLWTTDEQRKLEELLVKFPMEEVEARRWEKIATALGNRTAQQVASRVQKYFIKLTKAGLPVPGRIPNMTYYTNRKRGDTKRVHPFTKSLYQPSTFLQSVRPPVYMNEDDENIGWSGYVPGQDDDDDDDLISDDESIPVELRNSEEYHELLRLKKMKKDRLKQQNLMSHQGYKCDGCNMEPIVGIRWHCIDCPVQVSTDLCQACVDCDFSSPNHSSSHQMEPIQYHYGAGGPSFVDTDYTQFTPSTGDYNYLDPNYNPSALPT